MAIRVPRTWFNGLVDDNGTGNGTLWNKAAISGGIDATDVAFAQLDNLNTWFSYTPVASIGTAAGGFSLFGNLMFLWGYAAGTLPGAAIGWITFTLPAGYALPLGADHYLGTVHGSWTGTQELLGAYTLDAHTLKIRRASGAAFPANGGTLAVTWGAMPLYVVPGALDDEARARLTPDLPPLEPHEATE
jgi:hypothetical protein